ncbi:MULTISPECIES: hypothetical protein [unclassified Lentimonas]|uniref:hypothetical protein n=1 Tax=unclassified Lentimonas TaxID=2630993 RepID=UPI0013252767|nr:MULTISPECIES: hypothetical protein [unclassified Lentimonas]CAA6679774.1 Unannotated [Lentimonas sp. CC4]CAA6685715.1 Unannotated [Lentimonas sp. CC6]CAA6689466.1 Unannotated [Lentimonas sp. CC19]CAA6692500.1 Unannotated [Lentimonas sp. CC10]CAA7069139.1 Unannotated [Lentimonas sp. CC11]
MLEFNFNEEKKLLTTTATGIIGVNDIISHYEQLPEYQDKTRKLKVLIDVRKSQFELKLPDLSQTTETVQSALSHFESIAEAILVDEPSATAVTVIFQNYNSGVEGYQFKMFSTCEAAEGWLSAK